MNASLATQSPRAARHARLALAGVFVLALLVRLVGPLDEPALGQTDAYAHLQFLNDMLSDGRLRHSGYPSGYYALLCLPVWMLRVDPYYVVRYAGAGFGVLLVGALYALARRTFGRQAAFWTAFLAAAFPAFHWLQKTGVGAYPSQFGLILLPLILLAWDCALRGHRLAALPLAALMAALAWTVPMMLLDLLPFLVLDFAARAVSRECGRRAWALAGGAAAMASGGIALLALRGGMNRLLDTAYTISGLARADEGSMSALWRVGVVYVLPVRGLPENAWFRVASLIVGLALACILTALWRKSAAARMIGLWALFAWAQTVFGVFQFPLYLRAGWVLLMALAALGGLLVHETLVRMASRWRLASIVALMAAAASAFLAPPTPQPHLSPAESDLVVAARQLAAWAKADTAAAVPAWLERIETGARIDVWSRPYTGHQGHQGDPLYAFLERIPTLALRTLTDGEKVGVAFATDRTHIVFLDDEAAWRHEIGLMRIVAPAMTSDFIENRKRLLSLSKALRRSVRSAEDDGWLVRRFAMPQGLHIAVLRRRADL